LIFGTDSSKGVMRDPKTGSLVDADVNEVGKDNIVVHDAHSEDSSYAYALSRLSTSDTPYTPVGVFRSVEHPTYDDQLRGQVTAASAKAADRTTELAGLLQGQDTWTVA
jgi:2-oxoglutarate ferredoxin oxidoreductase subunit beta